MNFHIITLFPEICERYTSSSILGRAQKIDKGKGAKVRGRKIKVDYYSPRDFAADKHKKVDDRPYGGGPGMVMRAEPVLKAWQKAVGRKRDQKKVKTLIMGPRGKKFDTKMAKQLAKKYDHLVLISGRYEGIDSRVQKALKAEEISIGDYVLTGGELPALAIVDSVARQIPGVLGEFTSLEEERISSNEMYTRPETIEFKNKKLKVPPVFTSGHHANIDKKRSERS
jgi:tRNA (guanine37-N1)-methyltransferase